MLKFYNDLVKDKQEFKPLDPDGKQVLVYVCGPTVYDSPHIGHARAAIVFDILRRYLLHKGYDVTFVSNYTDVDDKMINRAEEEGIAIEKLADKYIKEYEYVMHALNVVPPDIKPKATETIDAMIELIQKMIANEYAYISNGSVYYAVDKYDDYKTLFMRKPQKDQEDSCIYEPLDESQTVDSSEIIGDKLCEDDFALWKKAKPGEPKWKSPWGEGRPGWHIECSAMAYKFLGEEIDIHGGGKDLIFPHHTNEIAQTFAAVGTKLARFWIHNGFVTIDNEKMSKSVGNFFTIEEVLKKYEAAVIRLLLSSINYRKPINYSTESLDDARENLSKILEFYETVKTLATVEDQDEMSNGIQGLKKEIEKLREEFYAAMDDDLNLANGLSQVYQLIRTCNKWILEQGKEIDKETKEYILAFMLSFSSIYGILIDGQKQELGVFGIQKSNIDDLIDKKEEEISELMELILTVRNKLRNEKMYDVADEIRDKLQKIGFELDDMKEKTLWKYSPEND